MEATLAPAPSGDQGHQETEVKDEGARHKRAAAGEGVGEARWHQQSAARSDECRAAGEEGRSQADLGHEAASAAACSRMCSKISRGWALMTGTPLITVSSPRTAVSSPAD